MLEKNHNLLYILLFFGMIGWGASWVNAKVLSHYIDAYDMIFMRFGITAITMVPIILYLKKSFKIDLNLSCSVNSLQATSVMCSLCH